MSFDDRYAGDIFSGHARNKTPEYPKIEAQPGLVVEVLADGFVGAVINFERTYDGDFIRLEDRYGVQRLFKMRPGAFLVEGQRATLIRYVPKQQPKLSHSGSRRVENLQARVALPSRILVEGVHDAALVEKIWGHDLRVEGVVVEYLEGLDNLPSYLAQFKPNPQRRIGVLADHLIEGSKETRLTQNLGPDVAVTGHPYIDIWAAVKPQKLGMRAWPEIPYGVDWKTGVCQALGWSDPREGWNRVYNAVENYKDLDSSLIGAVERLIDFVTNPHLTKEDIM
ncbi:DUF3097 domain-containing protein [Corynebacterium sp. sy039]|uniref:DUF3097 domain-containing protein n=1 Tax=Corynebacterium sp. sy039 TaxID=2599641 RepID=UPI0011B4558D|nr:DUF3097 domain-containing protein [Corynebacterium sp. sy039]QDZ42627.1 DUF3097 domain-containing protein [Corynebacterium sp. sy039]